MIDSAKFGLPDETMNLTYQKSIGRWDEAIPLGNGLLGCLVWGDGHPLRFSLDRGDLWDTREAPETHATGYCYQELIKLVQNKDEDAIKQRFDTFYMNPSPTKIPAGKVLLDYGQPCDTFNAILNLADASATLTLTFDNHESQIRTYIHASDHIGYLEISGTILPTVILSVPSFEISKADAVSKARFAVNEGLYGGLEQLNYPAAYWHQKGCVRWFIQPTQDEFSYAVVIAETESGDHCKHVAYTVATSRDGDNWLEKAQHSVECVVLAKYSDLYFEHASWWQNFWSQSAICLPEHFFQQQWYLANYFLGSCSRRGYPPMPLQGVWTADDDSLPPWKGDYHGDLNIQMSYWHYMKANHLDEGIALVDFLWKLLPVAKDFAKQFFDAEGICLPSVMSINGQSLGGWPMYSTNLTNQIWLCQAFDHVWRFSGDIAFLREKAYPYLSLTAQCVQRWLLEDDQGLLYLPLSSSPEIHDNRLEAWLKPNSNNDLALLIYLFSTLVKMARLLNNQEESKWQKVLDCLPAFAVNDQHILMLSPNESLHESHRHLSHLMALYPLDILNYDDADTRVIIDSTIQNLERLGTGLWAGHTYTWMASLYTRQRNGNGAYWSLKVFWETMCGPNGFCLNTDFRYHGTSALHHRVFTLETNMSAADALQEMLLQTHHGVIRVFPAIPNSWRTKCLNFWQFRGDGGMLISAWFVQGRTTCIQIEANQDVIACIENSFGVNHLHVSSDDSATPDTTVFCLVGTHFNITLTQGHKYNIIVEQEEAL